MPRRYTPRRAPGTRAGLPLSPEEARFVREYLVDFNAAHAARRAGWPRDPLTAMRAARIGAVGEAIGRALAERRAASNDTADRVLREVARIAFSDIRRIADFGPRHLVLHDPRALADDDAASIAVVAPAAGVRGVRVALYDKIAALDVLARHLGLFAGPHTPHRDGAPLPSAPPQDDGRRSGYAARAMLRARVARALGAPGPLGR
jgi:phage terminase small subunit